MGTKIKYMGTAHRCVLEAGEDFSGRLAEPLAQDVVWDVNENHHLVDADEIGLSQEAVGLLLRDRERFRDVTDLAEVPASLNERIFLGLPGDDDIYSLPSPPEMEAPNAAEGARQARARRQAAAEGQGQTPVTENPDKGVQG